MPQLFVLALDPDGEGLALLGHAPGHEQLSLTALQFMADILFQLAVMDIRHDLAEPDVVGDNPA